MDISFKRARYLQDSVPIRLGGIAANLARVNSFSSNSKHGEAVSRLLNESRYFIEWTASEAELDVQDKLVELQVKLSLWIHSWEKVWHEPALRAQMAKESREWSENIIKFSGIM